MSVVVSQSFEIRSAGSKGSGVYATRAYRPGELVHRLGGQRLTLLQCVLGIITRKIRIDDPLQIGNDLYIALDDLSIKFNHSCDANGAMCRESDLVAVRPIAPGDEITFDYALTVKPSFYSWAWTMKCACGAPNCRRKVGDISTVDAAKVETLREAGLLQDYILSYLKVAGR